MDSSKSPGAGTLLGLVGARAVGALGAGENAAGSDQEHVAVRELLLELTGEAVVYERMYFNLRKWPSYRCWILCQPWRRGTGTKMTIAFLP